MKNELIRLVEDTNKKNEIISYLITEGYTNQEIDEILVELDLQGLIGKGISGIKDFTRTTVTKFISNLLFGKPSFEKTFTLFIKSLEKLKREFGESEIESLIERSRKDPESRKKLENLLVRGTSSRIHMIDRPAPQIV